MSPPAPSGRLLRRGLRVMRWMVSLHPRPFAVAICGATLFALATVASASVLGWVTDHVIVPRFEEGHVPTGTVITGLAAIIGVGLLKGAGIIMRRMGAFRTVAAIGGTLRSRIARRYQHVPYEYHQRKPTGELLAHAGADIDAATEALSPVPFSVGVMVILVTTTVWLVVTDPYLALVGLVLFPIIIAANLVYQRRTESPAERAQQLLGSVSAVAHESFDGALLVKALGAEAIEGRRFADVSGVLRDAKIHVARLRATFEALLDAFPALAIVALLPIGAWRIESGAITTGTLVSFVTLFSIVMWPLRVIGYVLSEIPRMVVSYDRIKAVLDESDDDRHRNTGTPSESPRGRGAAVEVEGLTFAFGGAAPALEHVEFALTPGSTVAVVGPTGSGKSTLFLLLAGLVEAQAGTIRLDGRDLVDLSVDELRAQVAIAFQEPFLFGDTVRENILLGDAGDDVLHEAAALAGASGFIERLPDGFDTVVGERGATLSGGQRQRVALARALARRPRLLLLDDATSSVDPTTEAAILAGLASHLSATTTLVVANRPSTIALADEVLFLLDGRVVDHGTHTELMARQPGYERLVRAYELDRGFRPALDGAR